MESKGVAQTIHARRRAKERFGIKVKRKDIARIVKDIQRGRAEFVLRESERISIWKVRLGERLVGAVYDSERNTIVTFLKVRWVNRRMEEEAGDAEK